MRAGWCSPSCASRVRSPGLDRWVRRRGTSRQHPATQSHGRSTGRPASRALGKLERKPAFTYVWLRDGQEVKEGQIYTVTSEDRGYYISCLVIASAGQGEENEEVVESENSVLIPGEHGTPPRNEVPPEISPASGKVGTKLTCSQGTWSGNPTPSFTYQWFRSETAISKATTNSYTLEEADAGHEIVCKVTGTNSADFYGGQQRRVGVG